MLSELHEIVERIRRVTDAPLPEVLAPDAPVLTEESLAEHGFYIIGLIGGKNVGKSALVNAIVGEEITARTSCGPGTSKAIAYAHESQTGPIRELLETHAAGQHELITHDRSDLVRQVLLDLPDFDSHYATHVELTRRMLRHMLFPLCLQSIEKYADRQPRELLRSIAAGNDPSNFIFCLNKVDQLENQGGLSAAEEIRRDYAGRLAATLQLPEPPRVWLISALHPERYELPQLREMLSRERGRQAVQSSRQLATRRHALSVSSWIAAQRLPERLERQERLELQAREELTARLAGPLLETAVPGIVHDPAWAASVADEAMRQRVARWPLLNVLHLVLEPLLALLRGRVIPTSLGLQTSASTIVAGRLARLGQPPAVSLQAAFALLQQSMPLVSRVYRESPLWERMPADAQVSALSARLAGVLDARAAAVRERLARRRAPVRALVRWTVTIGAAVWFILLQPVLERFLPTREYVGLSLSQLAFGLAMVLVQVFSVAFLLRSLLFLAGFYLLLWLVLRWRTQQRVERGLRRTIANEADLQGQLAAVVLKWIDELLSPIRRERENLQSLCRQADRLTSAADAAAAA